MFWDRNRNLVEGQKWEEGVVRIRAIWLCRDCRAWRPAECLELLEVELSVPGTRCDWSPSRLACAAVCLPWAQSEFVKWRWPWGASAEQFCKAKAVFGALLVWVALIAFLRNLNFCFSRARNRRQEEEVAEACQDWAYRHILSLRTLWSFVCGLGVPWAYGRRW